MVIAEYCFSARTGRELEAMRNDLAQLYQLDGTKLADRVQIIQRSLSRQSLARAAGAADTLIAAHALAHEQTLVTCDSGFLHISAALKRSRGSSRLHVIHLAESGAVTERY